MWGWGGQTSGYCGSVSIQTAGLFWGSWITEDTIRGTSGGHNANHQILIAYSKDLPIPATSALSVCTALAYNCTMWNYDKAANPQSAAFLAWAKGYIDAGKPVMMGVYWVEGSDSDYDHIVPLVGYEQDVFFFNDLHSNVTQQVALSSFVRNRKECGKGSQSSGVDYTFCLPKKVDYGLAFDGNADKFGVLLPATMKVSSWTEPDYSKEDGRHELPVELEANVTVSGLVSGQRYALLRFDDHTKVPDSFFLKAAFAEKTEFIAAGLTYLHQTRFMSNTTAIFRCVRSEAADAAGEERRRQPLGGQPQLQPQLQRPPSLWPLPLHMVAMPGSPIPLSPASLRIVAASASPGSRSAVLQRAIKRYMDGGLIFERQGRGQEQGNGEGKAQGQSLNPVDPLRSPVFTLTLHVASADETLEVGSCGDGNPTIRCVNESYSLLVDSAAGGSIYAQSVYGALHALESFAQLVDGDSIAPVSVVDEPRFEYRGVMVDTARHFLTVDTIQRVLGAMSVNKLNVLQIHLTDDQSFPFQSSTHPNLTIHGAFQPNMTYSHDDIAKIVRYANDRGIVVQVETDMPAHAASWRGENGFIANNSGLPDPSKARTYTVIEDVIRELRELGVSTTHHIGGDEFIATGWERDRDVMQWAKSQGIDGGGGGCSRSAPSGAHTYNSSDCSLLCRFHMEHAKAAKRAGYSNIYMWSDASGCEGLNMLFPNAVVDLWGPGDVWHGCTGDQCYASDWGRMQQGDGSWHWYYIPLIFKHGWPGTVTLDSGTGFSKAVVSGCFHLECPSTKYNWTYNYACGARLQNYSGVGGAEDWNATQKAVVIGGHASRWGETTTSDNWFAHSFPAQAAAQARGIFPRRALSDSEHYTLHISFRRSQNRAVSRSV
eukprot:g1425.t1